MFRNLRVQKRKGYCYSMLLMFVASIAPALATNPFDPFAS